MTGSGASNEKAKRKSIEEGEIIEEENFVPVDRSTPEEKSAAPARKEDVNDLWDPPMDLSQKDLLHSNMEHHALLAALPQELHTNCFPAPLKSRKKLAVQRAIEAEKQWSPPLHACSEDSSTPDGPPDNINSVRAPEGPPEAIPSVQAPNSPPDGICCPDPLHDRKKRAAQQAKEAERNKSPPLQAGSVRTPDGISNGMPSCGVVIDDSFRVEVGEEGAKPLKVVINNQCEMGFSAKIGKDA